MCHDLCQIVPVLSDELIPLQQPLGTLPWVGFAESLERLVCGLASIVGVFSGVLRSSGPNFVATWIVDVETLSGLGFDPLAAYVTLVLENVRIVDLDVVSIWAGNFFPLCDLSRQACS